MCWSHIQLCVFSWVWCIAGGSLPFVLSLDTTSSIIPDGNFSGFFTILAIGMESSILNELLDGWMFTTSWLRKSYWGYCVYQRFCPRRPLLQEQSFHRLSICPYYGAIVVDRHQFLIHSLECWCPWHVAGTRRAIPNNKSGGTRYREQIDWSNATVRYGRRRRGVSDLLVTRRPRGRPRCVRVRSRSRICVSILLLVTYRTVPYRTVPYRTSAGSDCSRLVRYYQVRRWSRSFAIPYGTASERFHNRRGVTSRKSEYFLFRVSSMHAWMICENWWSDWMNESSITLLFKNWRYECSAIQYNTIRYNIVQLV